MKKKARKMRVYRSFEEYKKRYHPEGGRKKKEGTSDPKILGVNLARKSLEKIAVMLKSSS